VSRPVVTLGVDLSANERKTAVCSIRWEDGRALASVPERNLSNEALRGRILDAHWTGIDAPFSWPEAFREQLAHHAKHGGWDAEYRAPRYQYRETDLFVEGCARRPLSVSTDRIGVTAMRCARLLQELGEDRGRRLDLTGRDRVVEIYPAAALAAWGAKEAGFDPEGYKNGPEAKQKRTRLVEALAVATADWLEFPEEARAECVARDDPLDAFIAALATRAAQLKLTHPPDTEEQRRLAPLEGWIHIPVEGSLSLLAGGRGD
jgi:predicted nuclease with RNAse H fold